MPSSVVRTFTDPEDYATSIRATRAELTVIGRGRFTARLTRIDLHRLWMQRFFDNLPRVGHSAAQIGRAIISFRTEPGPSLLSSGVEMRPTNITRLSEGKDSFQRSSGSACWGAMSLRVEDMASVGAAMVGCDLTPPKDVLFVTPAPAAMARLKRLHAEAGRLAVEASEIIADPEAARGLEQALIEAMIGCLAEGEVGEDSVAQRRHELIMRRFRRMLEENPDEPLYLPGICKAIGVSDRTLRRCCQEHLGMGSKRYLLLRRMHLARRALRESSPIEATVAKTATQCGFWHFGHFAEAYQELFGETPSATLHRPPGWRASTKG